MVDRERLTEVRAVGVAVEVDGADRERVEHVGEVVDGRARRVAVDARPELGGATARTPDVAGDRAAQRRAVERSGQPGPAGVHEQQVAPAHQRPGQLEEVVAAVGGRVAGAALDGDDRPERRPAAVAPAVELEADPDLLARGREPVERDADMPAARSRRRVTAAVEVGLRGLRARRQAEDGEHGEQSLPHAGRLTAVTSTVSAGAFWRRDSARNGSASAEIPAQTRYVGA